MQAHKIEHTPAWHYLHDLAMTNGPAILFDARHLFECFVAGNLQQNQFAGVVRLFVGRCAGHLPAAFTAEAFVATCASLRVFFLLFAFKAKQKLEENSARWNVQEPFLGNQRQPKETEAAILGEVFHAKPFGPKNQPPAIWDSTGCSASKALTARRLAELPQKVCP